jgi:hypothetical protein
MSQDLESLRNFLTASGKDFNYPLTPDLLKRGLFQENRLRAGFYSKRRAWALAAALMLVMLLGGLAVPQVRAAVLNWLQVGAVQIFFDPVPTLDPEPTALPSFRELAGRVTLAEAQKLAGFEVPLPGGMREPEHVYFQDLGGPVVFCIWTQGDGIELSLMVLGAGAQIGKSAPPSVQESTIDGIRTAWLVGDHWLYLRSDYSLQNFSLPVSTNVLIWEEDGLTYRLAGEINYEQAADLMRSLER